MPPRRGPADLSSTRRLAERSAARAVCGARSREVGRAGAAPARGGEAPCCRRGSLRSRSHPTHLLPRGQPTTRSVLGASRLRHAARSTARRARLSAAGGRTRTRSERRVACPRRWLCAPPPGRLLSHRRRRRSGVRRRCRGAPPPAGRPGSLPVVVDEAWSTRSSILRSDSRDVATSHDGGSATCRPSGRVRISAPARAHEARTAGAFHELERGTPLMLARRCTRLRPSSEEVVT